VFWAAIISAILVVIGMLHFGTDEASFRASLRKGLERMFQVSERAPAGAGAPAAPRPELTRLIDLMVVALPPVAAVITTIVGVVNLWLAERIVKISGR